MRALVLIGVLLLVTPHARAQSDPRMAHRHARISELYKAERYAETMKEIDLQLKEAPGTVWEDSLHRYLYKYGRAYRKVQHSAAGVDAAERIYALVKQRGNANHEIEALFDLSWIYYEAGEMKQCARVDSIAVVVADRDPKVPIGQRGRARQYLAFDYSVIGDHRKSEKYALEALAQYAKADSIPPVQWAESYTAAGVANWHMGRIREAEGYYLKSLEILGAGVDEAVLVRKVSTYGNLGVLWQNAGDLTRARNYYQESLRTSDRVIAGTSDAFTRDEAIVNRSRTYLNLATVYFELGDDGRARQLLDMAWNDRSKVLQADDPQLLAVKDRIADLELSQGSLEKADGLVSTYLAACEKKFGTRSEEYIRACSKLGDIAMRLGETQRADSLFRISIEAGKRNTAEETDVVLASTLQRRAQLSLDAGRYRDASTDLEQARQVLVNTYGNTHHKVAAVEVRMAEVAFISGDGSSAFQHAKAALLLVNDRVEALRYSKVPQAFPFPHILPDALYWKVMADRKQSMNGDAKQEWNDDLDLAIASLQRNKSAVQDEASKLLLIGAQKRLFDLAMDIAYDRYAKTRSENDLQRFLSLSEADRSILLKSRLNAFAGLRYAGVPDSIISKEQELIAALEIDMEDRTAATNMAERERAYAEFMLLLEQQYPQYFALRYGEVAVPLSSLRERLLTEERALLVYASTNEYLYMLTVGSTGTQLLRTSSAGLSEQVRALNASIAARDPAKYCTLSHDLYKRIFAPVATQLVVPELLIIPDGELHSLNFEVLLSAASSPAQIRQNLLLQRHAIAYLLSASTALQFADLARDRSRGVLAIAPGFSDELKQDYLANMRDTSFVDRDFLRYVRQPFAVRTAQALQGSMQAHLLVGQDATEKSFRGSVNNYGILHLGTHAEMNAISPMYSRLVLSKDGSGMEPDSDGYLHAYEIYELDLRAQLAVLTACETGVGKDDGAEGVRSLGHGFAFAGCPSLLVSLWQIDEKVSSEIVTRFYAYLAKGMHMHLALRQAKLDHLATASDDLVLPYYWAGMVIIGDVAPVEIDRSWNWLLITGMLVLTAGVVWFFHRRKSRRTTSPGHH